MGRAQSYQWILGTLAILGVCSGRALADSATIAVATNFAATAKVLIESFERKGTHEIRLITGSSGKLYAQIKNGAPVDVFLSADMDRPARLVTELSAMRETLRVYASGRLLLWRPRPSAAAEKTSENFSAPGPEWLREVEGGHIALANPELAPYGHASREVLGALGLVDEIRSRLVYGENIGQTYAMVATGNAALGFIARAQIPVSAQRSDTIWEVPASFHGPIQQGVVQLVRARNNEAASAWIAYLASEEAKDVIREAGYEVE